MTDQRRWWHRLLVDGTLVDVMNEVVQTESLEGSAPPGATIRLANVVADATGDTTTLYLVDLATATGIGQLAGKLDEIDAESFPHVASYVLLGTLAKLRKTRTSDFDLSGMTDGEVVENALTFCGITFTSSDIVDCGYVLGTKAPNTWLAHTSGADMIAEIDRVFQTRTMEIGAGRVVRIRYNLVPSASDAVATFSRGSSDLYWGGHRRRGKFDSIRNIVNVRGARYDCGDDDSCSCTVWAHAEADHPKLGSGVRSVPIDFQSDLIQTTGLAVEIAKDLMRRYNREQDVVRVRTENNPNITPGKVFTVKDQAVGMDLPALAPYQIVDIQRTGNVMVIDGVGGAAGATGTLTNGIEKVCNDVRTQVPETPSFSFPGITFPPIVTGGISISEEPGQTQQHQAPGACEDCDDLPTPQERAVCQAIHCAEGHEAVIVGELTQWVEDSAVMDEGPAGVRFDDFGAGHYEGVEIEPGQSWEIRVVYDVLRADIDVGFVIGQDAFAPWLEVYTWAENAHPDQRRMRLAVYNLPTDPDAEDPGSPWPGPGDICVLTWTYDDATEQSTATLEYGSTTLEVSATTDGSIGAFNPSYFGMYVSAGSGSGYAVELNSLQFRFT